jgi:hypothetical protein
MIQELIDKEINMAVWAKIDPAQPIRNGGAYGDAPQQGDVLGPTRPGTTELLEINWYHEVLDDRYKVGGTTTWERPGQA